MTLIGRVGQSSVQAAELAKRNAAHKAPANGRSDNTGISRNLYSKFCQDLNRAAPLGSGVTHARAFENKAREIAN
jgi:hypothetical protein